MFRQGHPDRVHLWMTRRWKRTIVSIRAVLKAWPMCRLPVTFGGGITTLNGSPGALASGWKAPACSQAACQRASVPAGS
jgi:hypothetical protein